MRTELKQELKHKYRFDGADELPLDDVEEIYDRAIQSFGQHDDLKNQRSRSNTRN
jgi:hypothetical protein